MFREYETNTVSDKIAGFLVTKQKTYLIVTALLTLLFILPALKIQFDSSGVTFNNPDSKIYKDYEKFIKTFGTDNYVLLAVENQHKIYDPVLGDNLQIIHLKLSSMANVLGVLDLSSLESSKAIRLLKIENFWDANTLTRLRHILPGLSQLVSQDFKTLLFLVKVDNKDLNGFQFKPIQLKMQRIVSDTMPGNPYCHATGIPVIQAAFERYNIQNAFNFGLLGLVFGSLVAFYIFKTMCSCYCCIDNQSA